MTPPLDAQHVRRAFGRAATTYTQHAALQREVEDRLLERLEYYAGEPTRVLDVGCGPGRGSEVLRKRFSSAQVIALDLALPMLRRVRTGWRRPLARVCADARALPLPDTSIDVLYSNLCVQWIDDLPALFGEFRRVLRPGGYLALSTFGQDTLHEPEIARVGRLRRAGYHDVLPLERIIPRLPRGPRNDTNSGSFRRSDRSRQRLLVRPP